MTRAILITSLLSPAFAIPQVSPQTAQEVVAATLDHGRMVHNMDGTRDDVLARAERLPAAADAATDARP